MDKTGTTMIADGTEHKYAGVALDGVEADGSFSGYASLFGEIDLGKDRVEPGAFSRSISRRGVSGIRMLYQHDPARPIGRWTEIREDTRGLFVSGQLSRKTDLGREVLELMRDRALDGLSIGFRTIRSRTEAKSGVRRILEADLWEISVVTFPMLPGARVEAVKSGGRKPPVPTKREIERRLTRDAGLSRGQARALIAKGYAAMSCERDAAHQTQSGLAGTIRQAANIFK
ncbi:MAG: HK97 family phage prohead protease [Rhizobiaceae bacterium]